MFFFFSLSLSLSHPLSFQEQKKRFNSKKKKEETLKDYAEIDVTPQIEQQIPTKKVTMESFFLTKTAQKIMNKGKGHVA